MPAHLPMVEVLNILLRGKGLFIPVYFCGLRLPLFCIKLAVASVDANKIVHSLAYAVSFLATYVIA